VPHAIAGEGAVGRGALSRTVYTTQLEFWELDDEQWRKIMLRPYERRPPSHDSGARQLPLPVMSVLAILAVICAAS
jgi:hypothetical protein